MPIVADERPAVSFRIAAGRPPASQPAAGRERLPLAQRKYLEGTRSAGLSAALSASTLLPLFACLAG